MTLGSVESLISDLSKQQANYIPAEGVQRDLASKRLIMLISATSMGKSSLINKRIIITNINRAGIIARRATRNVAGVIIDNVLDQFAAFDASF